MDSSHLWRYLFLPVDIKRPPAAFNSDLLREVNERIAHLARAEDTVLLICECAGPSCVEQVRMRRADFDAIRVDDGLVLAPGHRLQVSQSPH